MKKKMDSVISELLIVFIFSWGVLGAKEYVIIQRKRSIYVSTGTKSTLKAQPDRFIIPSSLCWDDDSAQCEKLRGSRVSNCTCECDRTASGNGEFSFSTFGLDSAGKWKCLENAKVHERSGCSVILNNWANDSALITVPKVGVASYEIPMQFRNFHIYKPTSKAQDCDGSWTHLDYKTFEKEVERFSVNKTENKQYLKFNYSGNSSQQVMSGRIIKLGGTYHNASNMIVHVCILLKVQGEMQCKLKGLFSLPPTATPSTTQPSFISSRVKSTLFTSTGSTRNNPNTHITSNGPPTVTMITGKTSVPMVIKTNAKITSSDDHTGLIAGAVAGVVGLIALVIVIVLVRRRKKRNTVAKRTGVVAENIGYGTNRVQRPLEDQEEYSYADTSAVSINKRDQQPRNKGAQNAQNVSNPMHGSVADYPPHIHQDPEYATVNKATSKRPTDERNEPVYHVLEGPETDGSNENEPPCYHVLEGPYPDSGPFYDVLEEPESVTHLASLNSTWKMPNARPEVEENKGYDDTVYDSVEEIIPDTGDIYQQLDQDGQGKPGVYQALNYGKQAMPLTKLNVTHSEA